jgi:heme exporter protein B
LFAAALTIARKDLTVEFRTRTAFFSALLFALLAVVVFNWAWDRSAVTSTDIAPGVLWVTFIFSGLLALNRAFTMEAHDRALDGLLVAPVPRESIFVGKALANFVFVAGVQVIAIPAVFFFYSVPVGPAAPGILLTAVLAGVALVSVGTLFSALASNTRLAELLLPMLALPFFFPILTAASQTTWRLLTGRPLSEVVGWLQLLAAFDIVFVAACTIAFPFTLEE